MASGLAKPCFYSYRKGDVILVRQGKFFSG